MLTYTIERASSDELQHFGIKGQKWGVRRYQELNGTLTKAGIDRYRSKQQRKHDKYQEKADALAKSAKNDHDYRKQIEDTVHTYTTGKGQAWRQFAESETRAARKAIEAQDKANKYMSEGEKKNVRDFLLENGIESERFSAKNLRKADKAVLKAVMKDSANFTRKDELRIFNESLDKSQGKEIGVKERHPGMIYDDGGEMASNYIRDKIHVPYMEVAYSDKVYKKHKLDQSTAYSFIEKPKYKAMIDYIDKATKAKRDEAVSASNKAVKSGETMRKPGKLWADMTRKNLEYWDSFDDVAKDYLDKHFMKDEQDLAKGVLYYAYIDW